MKKALSLSVMFILLLSLFLVGCSSNESSNSSSSNGGNESSNQSGGSESEADSGSTEKVTLKVGYVNAEGSPVDQGANKFKELVAEKTNGQVEVQVFPNSQLGGERDMLEGMKIGTVDIVITGDAAFPMFAPEFGGLSLPYVMRDIDHMLNVLNGPIGEEISTAFNEELDSVVLDWWIRGPRNLTASKLIESPEDVDGMKLRVPEIPLSVEAWKAIGANPTPMAFPELFVGLQQGVVDGQENPLDLIYTSKFYEVQSHVMLTEHIIAPFIVLMNEKKLTGLSEELQTAINEAMLEAGDYEKKITRESDEEYKQKLEEAGMTVVEVDKDLFRQKVEEANVAGQFESEWAPDLLKRIAETK